ncbi:MAG: rhodanese-like domain-containing protein [Planctomycetota bacterium]
MVNRITQLSVALFACLWFSGCATQPKGETALDEARKSSMLIEPAELEAKLGSGMLILDTRSKEAHDASHIPGSFRVDVKRWQNLGRREGGFRDAEAWQLEISAFGIDDDTRIVVYGDRLSNTGRVWWLLKYIGVEHAMILNGGWGLWESESRPASDTPQTFLPPRGKFQVRFDTARLAEIDPLKSLLGSDGIKIVDTRSEDEFTGKDARGPRGGHLPGATHLEWKELLAADGRFKTQTELRDLFGERGILPAHTAVCY